MRKFGSAIYLSILLILSLFFVSDSLCKETGTPEDRAIVTLLRGKAFALHKGEGDRIPLKVQDVLYEEDRVSTCEKALLEIRLPDGSFVRFADNTSFKVSDLSYERESGSRSFKLRLFLGRSWANVKELVGRNNGFEITSENAVAGVKGTVYRMNVRKDKSVLIKVYKGRIRVTGPPREIPRPVSEVGGLREVPGPRQVPGPREVSLEEWEYIVKDMQKIIITPEGKALKPVYFSREEDINDWVFWNKRRDERIKIDSEGNM